jgi:hypothetical protein
MSSPFILSKNGSSNNTEQRGNGENKQLIINMLNRNVENFLGVILNYSLPLLRCSVAPCFKCLSECYESLTTGTGQANPLA